MFATGDHFEGQMRDGLMHGHGSYTSASGLVYKGSFRDGMRSGSGVLTRLPGYMPPTEGEPEITFYEGLWAHDLQHGTGTSRYSDNSTYDGQWANGNRAVSFPPTSTFQIFRNPICDCW